VRDHFFKERKYAGDNKSGNHIFHLPDIYPVFLVILHVAGNIGGMETTGKIRQIAVTENSLFY
jgi:hypothetical protein